VPQSPRASRRGAWLDRVDPLSQVSRVAKAGLGLVVLALLVPTGFASAALSNDQGVARRLVVAKADAAPLSPGYLVSWHNGPCPMPTVDSDKVTARASGNWGGVSHGLWSAAVVISSPTGAQQLYRRLIAALPACLRRSAENSGRAAVSGYKMALCKRAALHPLSYGQYGDQTRAWRAEYSTRYATGCTVRALDGVAVRAGRAVALYVFDNANAKGHNGALIAARDEAIVHQAVIRSGATS